MGVRRCPASGICHTNAMLARVHGDNLKFGKFLIIVDLLYFTFEY